MVLQIHAFLKSCHSRILVKTAPQRQRKTAYVDVEKRFSEELGYKTIFLISSDLLRHGHKNDKQTVGEKWDVQWGKRQFRSH